MSQQLLASKATTKQRKRYSLDFKLRLILHYEELQVDENLKKEEKSFGHIQRITGIDRRTFSDWLSKKPKIVDAHRRRTSFRVPNTNVHCICEVMEQKLKTWILKKRDEGIIIVFY